MTAKPDAREYLPRLIAWEVTRSCPMACKHCRAAAQPKPYAGELTTDEGKRVLDSIASFAKPTMILTGGEPMLRTDIYELAGYAHSLGLPVVMAPCGMYVTRETVERMKRSGIHCISISLDGATAATHDDFRGVAGAFDMAMAAVEAARDGDLNFQINTTITQHNLKELPALLELTKRLGASAFNPFLLVPTGRGKDLAGAEISPEDYEATLHWLAEQEGRHDIAIRVTCAPHYTRILKQHPKVTGCDAVSVRVVPPHEHPVETPGGPSARPAGGTPLGGAGHGGAGPGGAGHGGSGGKGCMGGKAFAFISHIAKVQICGFLETVCGDLRETNFDFRKIWDESEVFKKIRDVDAYAGKCGVCEYRRICGGCRARAFAMTDDYLAEEPFCVYQPGRRGEE